jgi:DNA invertase Pin-like site-specific DNA recombinase
MASPTKSGTNPHALHRAAQYIRMSTDHQEYSPLFQREAIAEYARAHNFRVVCDYEDAGLSGLTFRQRPALVQLLLDVENPRRRFNTILVFDVSRWGRFQDVDEAAFYEYACRRAGVNVIYVAESFSNDASPATSVMKALKRAMAAEFSREMSRKVFLGQCLNAQRGFHAGGPPGYGLQRILIDSKHETRRGLARYEYKSVQSDRVVIAPASTTEASLVRKMYEWYATQTVTGVGIAKRLNDFGLRNRSGRPWDAQNILRILRNEAYVGTNVYSRTSSKLDGAWQQVPRQEWIRLENAFEPVVDRRVFAAVQKKMEANRRQSTRAEILDGLRKVIAKAGKLDQATLRYYRSAPSVEQVMREFGSLYKAYDEVGYVPRLASERSLNRRTEQNVEHHVADVTLDALRRQGHDVRYEKHTSTFCVDKWLRLNLAVRSPWLIGGHLPYWVARWPDRFPVDFLVYGRIERAGAELLDFHIFPRGSLVPGAFTVVCRHGQTHFGMYQRPDLRSLLVIAESVPFEITPVDGTTGSGQ